MLKVVLTVDCEKFISLSQISPRWNRIDRLKGKINNFLKNLRYNKNGFDVVYPTIVNQKMPATFMIVGKIFAPKKSPKFISWGYHSLDHLPLTMISKEEIKKQVKNIYNVKNFCAPLWMIEDINCPNKVLDEIKKEKYENVVYKGKDNGPKNHEHKLNIKEIIKKNGLKFFWVSNTFEGNSSKKHIQEIMNEIIKNSSEDKICLLTTHDFTHKNNKNLMKIISFLKKLEKEKKIEIKNMEEIK